VDNETIGYVIFWCLVALEVTILFTLHRTGLFKEMREEFMKGIPQEVNSKLVVGLWSVIIGAAAAAFFLLR